MRRKMSFPGSEKQRKELPCLGLCSQSMAELGCEPRYISMTLFTQIDVASRFLSSLTLTAQWGTGGSVCASLLKKANAAFMCVWVQKANIYA